MSRQEKDKRISEIHEALPKIESKINDPDLPEMERVALQNQLGELYREERRLAPTTEEKTPNLKPIAPNPAGDFWSRLRGQRSAR